jgi:O-antigen/teichoic acid export membrane protein
MPSAPENSTMPRDVVSAYALTAARVIAWILVSATVYRRYPPDYFAALSLIRWTIGLLAYTSIGLGPAMVHALAHARHNNPLDVRQTKSSGIALSIIAAVLTLLLTLAYRQNFTWLHRIPAGPMIPQFAGLILFFGIGDALRVLSEPQGAILQTENRIATDNLILLAGEIAWAILSILQLPHTTHPNIVPIATSFAITSFAVWIARLALATDWRRPDWFTKTARTPVILSLLSFGIFVLVSQLSDFLYAPTDLILINRLLSPSDLAAYAPAIQIDAGLLLLMTGLASVLLPKAALAHAAGDRAAVKRYYLRGTVLGGSFLAFMSAGAWLISKPLLHAWLKHPLPQTRAILPLVLINTIIGGSSAVGRSILLGMGRVRTFSIAVIIAAVTNVIFSIIFVKYCGLGLYGIVLGTIVAVVARCAIWMPWYVLKTLRQANPIQLDAADAAADRGFDVVPME